MKKWPFLFFSVIAASVIFAGCANEAKPAADTAAPAASATGENVLNIEASNWKFNQDKFEAKAGQPITINFKSVEGVHGLAVEGLDVDIAKEGSKTFTPDKPGEYKITCSIPCGPDHDKMISTLVVK